MARITKRERIDQYNKQYNYHITNIKKLPREHVEYRLTHGAWSLDELYKSYSDAKRQSYQWILDTYKPTRIGLEGNCMTYSAVIQAANGDILWITRDNNYIVEVTE